MRSARARIFGRGLRFIIRVVLSSTLPQPGPGGGHSDNRRRPARGIDVEPHF